MTKNYGAVCALLSLVGLIGCSGGTASVPLPDFDPDTISAKAMELHDTDGDGFLSLDEIEKAPGINAALKNLDLDADGKVSAEEIAQRVRTWQEMKIGLMSISCEVYLDRQPLVGASVTFEPEACLGDSVKTAIAETGLAGTARPKVPKEDRPSPDSPPGIQAGFFRVKVSKKQGGQELIPARYNTETTLGQQVSRDDYAIANKRIIFHLKSN